ncbi:MAG: hypothetical protein DRN71_03830 [Candidatus Nanohalarchaeota archaeon]|nr:MAG: hypothetical protein DRN71_03830 [Candidatus Nanohaloarchaeota archaeon]
MTQVKITEAESHDVQAIADIAAEAFWREYGSREKAEKAFRDTVAKRWLGIIERRSGIVLVAKEGRRVVGFLVFRWWFGWYGWLEAIAVKEGYRGRGIGKQLLKTLIDKARRQGYTKICLAVDNKDPVSFYKKFGAKKFGELPDDKGDLLELYYIPLKEDNPQNKKSRR